MFLKDYLFHQKVVLKKSKKMLNAAVRVFLGIVLSNVILENVKIKIKF
jgi:hypothetical protein